MPRPSAGWGAIALCIAPAPRQPLHGHALGSSDRVMVFQAGRVGVEMGYSLASILNTHQLIGPTCLNVL